MLPQRFLLPLMVLTFSSACLPTRSLPEGVSVIFTLPAQTVQGVLSPRSDLVAYATDYPPGLWLLDIADQAGGPRRLAPVGLNPQWSPDGLFLVYEADSETTPEFISTMPPDLALLHLASEQRFEIGPGQVFWAPDSTRFAYHPAFSGELQLWDTLGTRHTLLDQGVGLSPPNWRAAVAWSPDGNSLAATRRAQDGTGAIDLWLVDVETGSGRSLVQLPLTETVVQLAWSPDGDQLAVAATPYDDIGSDAPDGSRIWRVEIPSGQTEELGAGLATITDLAWRGKGRELAFIQERGTGRSLWLLDGDTGELTQVPTPKDIPPRLRWRDANDLILDGGATEILRVEWTGGR